MLEWALTFDESWNLNPCIWRPWLFEVRNLIHDRPDLFSHHAP